MKLKKLISIVLFAICMLSITACGSNEITPTIKPFPKFQATDFKGNAVTNEIFKGYDVTVVNFWTNGCGSCIAEMPELEEYYQNFKGKKINLIAVAASAGDSKEALALSKNILKGKGVTYMNIIPNMKSPFYKDFISEITGYPTTYIVDGKGNIIGAPLIGVVKNQEDKMMKRIDEIVK
ncbi:TlpA family protein disulfide reductase [Clostridium estertheticum]|uniref:TlpA family protein disulfide reductase n=1 Tax=Clostridium estertheticum TaxID=238834 RepID=UPI001CD10A5A|nr:TlpA disulfide reductase family protein [Clostridium estertheticum]MBZ9685670.1 TlpA family protein disulfide reductase [Clostridium estertheticum]